jgi:hypothetical protein
MLMEIIDKNGLTRFIGRGKGGHSVPVLIFPQG